MLLRALLLADARSDDALAAALRAADVVVATTTSVATACSMLRDQPVDVVMLDARGRETSTLETLESLRAAGAGCEVVVVAGQPAPVRHDEWIAGGAFAVVYDGAAVALTAALGTLLDRLRVDAARSIQSVPDQDYRLTDYATASPVMQRFLHQARQVARRDTTVLLLGETGVGKGLLARSLHNEGRRAGGPFVSVNCGALSETLLDSELFGHARGAFTGADRARRGRFELAHQGTIFLDEVGELPSSLQVKLLHVLEDRRVQPLGTERDLLVDVRVIAATNRRLDEEVAAQRFRSDLFYRLNVVSLELPPLRDRREDIAEIANSYVEHFRVKLQGEARELAPEAVDALLRYPWPGNVRELANAMERAVIMAGGPVIQLEDLPMAVQEHAPATIDATTASHDPNPAWLRRPWADVRREVVERAEIAYLSGMLAETGGRIAEVARRAGMDPRSLYEKMRKYGLRKEAFRRSGGARA